MTGPGHRATGRKAKPQTLALLGVDTGGTFTDLVGVIGSEVRTHKVLSTPHNPAEAVFRGVREMLPEARLGVLTYASTVATNALLQRTGARVVLLTTAGFEDVIEIGRQNRPKLYDLEPCPPAPLVPRQCRIGVRERAAYDGSVLVPLRSSVLRRALRAVRRHRAEAVAVCFLHSYANPAHERLARTALAQWPDLYCSLSHELVAEYREYERTSTTVINAYVGPVMSRHLQELQQGLQGARLRVMQSNGGAISVRLAGREAVRTVLSGPAAGVIGARAVADDLGLERLITFDMGGTSTDVSLVDKVVGYTSDWTIGGLPLKVPAIDIHTVGAGGGSIAEVDEGGALKVGPRSAGADPGPACYGRGTVPTVTDANVVLGRLLPHDFLGGSMHLQPQRASQALAGLRGRLRLSEPETAEGIVRVVNASMERAVRRISVERGHEPRAYTLIAFGGAAGQHACELSAALGIQRVVIPRNPGLLSAWGATFADVQRDYVRTVRLNDPSALQVRALLATMVRAAHVELAAQGVAVARRRIRTSLDVRYRGQSFEIAVAFNARFAKSFHAAHRRLYGYADPQRPIEVVNLRVTAVGRGSRLRRRVLVPSRSVRATPHRVRWAGRWLHARIYKRPEIAVGAAIHGPALITEFSATTLLPPGWRCRVHPSGHLQLDHAH